MDENTKEVIEFALVIFMAIAFYYFMSKSDER